jgi:hypothetical protein
MKTLTAVLGLLLSAPILAVQAPKIVAGDYLLVYARIVNCGPELQAIEAGHVDERGIVTLLGLRVIVWVNLHDFRAAGACR